MVWARTGCVHAGEGSVGRKKLAELSSGRARAFTQGALLDILVVAGVSVPVLVAYSGSRFIGSTELLCAQSRDRPWRVVDSERKEGRKE